MILSDKTIMGLIAQKKIKIDPPCNPKDVRPVGIRLHLGKELLIPIGDQRIDLESKEEIKFDRISILKDGFVLKPGQFILGSTLERLQVPKDIVCHIEGRSTIARLGLAIHCTDGVIDGNFEEARTVMLEMKNLGPFEIILRYKTALAMLTFSQLTTDIEQLAQEQYRGQEGTVAPNLRLQKQ